MNIQKFALTNYCINIWNHQLFIFVDELLHVYRLFSLIANLKHFQKKLS
jgi:hypothetical protein